MTANFNSDITNAGAITLTSPAGEVFGSRPIGLFYADTASGKVAQIGSVQACQGVLYPPNILVFSNVLSGLRADLMLVWAKNGYEQNLVIEQNPPRPESLGLSSATTRIQFWTAMDSFPTVQQQRAVTLSSGLVDHILYFQGCWFPVGSLLAFGSVPMPLSGQAAQVRAVDPSVPGTVQVAKSLATIGGSTVIIEEANYADLLPLLSSLPQASLEPKVGRTVELANRSRFLPAARVLESTRRRPMVVASAPYSPKAVVLDYTTLNGTQSSYTFMPVETTTYWITNTFTVTPNTATFSTNACIKFNTNSYLLLEGPVAFPSTGSPVVFTSADDNAYGQAIGSGNPGYAANPAIWMYYQGTSTTVQNALVSWAQRGMHYTVESGGANQNLYSSAFQHCTNGVNLDMPQVTLYLSGDTYCDTATPVYTNSGYAYGSPTLNCGDTQFALANSDLQHESTVTINPGDPTKVAIFSANYYFSFGLLEEISTNGGNTWSFPALIATGSSPDGLPAALSDPQAAYDEVGNLFLCYTTPNNASIVLAKTRDNGTTWSVVKTFTNSSQFVDRPVIATGPGGTNATSSVWVLYVDGYTNDLILAGAPVGSDGTVSNFTSYALGCSTGTGVVGQYQPVGTGLAVGPTGKVVMAYETRYEPTTSSRLLYINVDTDGLGPNEATNGCTTQIQVNMEYNHYIPAQPDRNIFRVPVLAWDRGSISHSNRIYVAFADATTTDSTNYDTDVYVMYSDNYGATWSDRLRVNNDTTTRSQFFPAIAVDQTSGLVAVSWYDCRNNALNEQTQFYAAVSTDGFTTAQPRNVQLTTTFSYSHQANCPCCTSINYGDYSGLAFYGGYFFPTWCSYANTTDSCGDGHTCRIAW